MSSAFERLQKLAKEKQEANKPKLELVDPLPTPPTAGTDTTQDTPPTKATAPTPRTPPQVKEVSPERDFTKIPNSIRRAEERGLFKGKSKQLYDSLYHQTRGKKFSPVVSAKLKKKDLMKWSGIGSERTFLKNLDFLKSLGLVAVTLGDGQHDGNEYSIYIPEELSNFPPVPTPPTAPHAPQKVGRVGTVETAVRTVGLNDENKEGYASPKTLFKDFEYIDDDSPLYEALRELNRAAKEQTGKRLNKADMQALLDLFEIFINETNLAAGRAKSVSSYTALGVENLRRRLYPKTKPKTPQSKKSTDWQTVGKPAESAEPLDEDIRRTVLESLRQIINQNGREAVEMFSSNYTSEDWTWLMKELDANG